MTQKKKNQEQNDQPIRALDPIDHVRLRPGMYIGGVDTKALNNVFNELLDYVIHQARTNVECSVAISLLGPQTLSVRDNSSAMPLHVFSSSGITRLEAILCVVGAGGLLDFIFEGEQSGSPSLALVNPLSCEMHVEIRRDGALWQQLYKKGRKTGELARVRDLAPDEEHGTMFTLTVDDEIFGDSPFDAKWIEKRLCEIAFLLPGLKISFENQMTGQKTMFHYPAGLEDFLRHVQGPEPILHPPITLRMQQPHRGGQQRITRQFEFEAAIQFLVAPGALICGFVNGLERDPRGRHISPCFAAMTDSLLGHSAVIKRSDLPRLFSRLRMIVSLWHPAPGFQNSMGTGGPLINGEIYQPIYEELCLALVLFFKDHPDCIPQLEALVLENRKRRHARLI